MEQKKLGKKVTRYVVMIERTINVPEQIFGPASYIDCMAYIEGYVQAWVEYSGGMPQDWMIYTSQVQILEVVL